MLRDYNARLETLSNLMLSPVAAIVTSGAGRHRGVPGRSVMFEANAALLFSGAASQPVCPTVRTPPDCPTLRPQARRRRARLTSVFSRLALLILAAHGGSLRRNRGLVF